MVVEECDLKVATVQVQMRDTKKINRNVATAR